MGKRRLGVLLPVHVYDGLAQLAVMRQSSMSTIVSESIELLLRTQVDPDMSVRVAPRRNVCLDPDKMHGAGDGFGGSDEGSHLCPKKL